MFESPFKAMEIFGSQLLCWGWLRHVLMREGNTATDLTYHLNNRKYQTAREGEMELTSGGRHSVACLRRTENPPWVLVSEAVRILLKDRTVGLGGSGRVESRLVGSLCCRNQSKNWIFNSLNIYKKK